MRRELSPLAERVFKIYRTAIVFCAIGIPALLFTYLPGSGFLWWLAIIGIYGACLMVLPKAILFVVLGLFYREDLEEITEEAEAELDRLNKGPAKEEPEVEVFSLKVTKTSGKAIARYLDTDIFEWLDLVDDDGKKYTATYEGTVELRKGVDFTVPVGCIFFHPGILYRFMQDDKSVNSST